MRKVPALTALAIALMLAAVHHISADDAKSKDEESADALLIKAQKICPVTGDEFDHGEALKTKVDGAVMFLCCEDCKGKPVDKAHMATITANLITAQGKCPVMGKTLPKDAPAIIVEERKIFVCCKPCIKKVQAEPKKFIAKVDAMLRVNLKEKTEGAPKK